MTGDEFRAIRRRLGLSQQELASKLGYKQSVSISKYETGTRKIYPPLETLMQKLDEEALREMIG